MSRWIKIDVETPQKRQIRKLAKDCGVSIGDAFLAFFRLYAWLDEQTADGVLCADPEDVDATARLPGTAASLAASGWLAFYDDGTCVVKNWNEHNGQSAKKRAIHAQQQNEYRDRRRKQGLPVRPLPRRE